MLAVIRRNAHQYFAVPVAFRRITTSLTTRLYQSPRRPDHNQMKAETQGFHLVMVWPHGTSIPLSRGSRCGPLNLSVYIFLNYKTERYSAWLGWQGGSAARS